MSNRFLCLVGVGVCQLIAGLLFISAAINGKESHVLLAGEPSPWNSSGSWISLQDFGEEHWYPEDDGYGDNFFDFDFSDANGNLLRELVRLFYGKGRLFDEIVDLLTAKSSPIDMYDKKGRLLNDLRLCGSIELDSHDCAKSFRQFFPSLISPGAAQTCHWDWVTEADEAGAAPVSLWVSNCTFDGCTVNNLCADSVGFSPDCSFVDTTFHASTFRCSDFSGVTQTKGLTFVDCDLRGANLDADFSESFFFNCDLSGAWIKSDFVPPRDLEGLASCRGLDTLRTTNEGPSALIRLRDAFRHAGYFGAEEAVNSARVRMNRCVLARSESFSDRVRAFSQFIFIELTTGSGSRPTMALRVLIGMSLLFSSVYTLVFGAPTRRTRIQLLYRNRELDRWSAPGQAYGAPKSLFRVAVRSSYFSALQAFRVGFRDFSVGRWLESLTHREYEFKTRGWVRSISGVQSLLSLYLLAIWVLTEFGRPFHEI